nr:FAD-binding protein [Nocardioides ginsengisegetis]
MTVASARDVATAIGFARQRGLPVAIRSGGHSYPGWSGGGSPRALVLDCRALSTVDLAADGTATIGAGATLAPVYDTLGSRDRAIAGGSCATVGVAGLTLGGGVGVLTRGLGLTCDAVTAMEVVTADGRIRRVTADDDPDLFWALRGGGGGHLGVVTSFEMRTSAAPDVGSAFLQWPLSAAPEVLPAWQAWAPGADPRLWSTIKALGGTEHPDGPVLLVSATWTGPANAFAAQLAGLLDHVPAPGVRVDHRRAYRDAMRAYGGDDSTREAFGATSHVAYDPLPDAGIAALVGQVEDAAATGLLEAGISIDALGGRVRDLAPDATAFVHREALATVQYTATYTHGPPATADDYVRGFRSTMSPWWGRHAYVNYADAAIEDPSSAYFGANAPRLRSVRETYDPDRFFTQLQDY